MRVGPKRFGVVADGTRGCCWYESLLLVEVGNDFEKQDGKRRARRSSNCS